MNDMNISRRGLLKTGGSLVVSVGLPVGSLALGSEAEARVQLRPLNPTQLDTYLAIDDQGLVTMFWGKMDMGQGTDTGMAMIVAEELDVPIDHVTVVQGDSNLCVDQGGASGSTGIQRSGVAFRNAAAEARRVLVEAAARELGADPATLTVTDGVVHSRDGSAADGLGYGDIIGGEHFNVTLEWNGSYGNGLEVKGIAEPKPVSEYKLIGTPVARKDVPGKILATRDYAHHVQVAGMMHGRMLRPPRANQVPEAVDEASIAGIPGARVVWRENLLGVVAETEWDAIRAAEQLAVTWSEPAEPAFPTDSAGLFEYMRSVEPVESHAGEERDVGDVEGAFGSAARVVEAEYEWPMQMHARMSPAFGLVDVRQDGLVTVWTDSQKPHDTRLGVANILGLPPESVHGIWLEGSGSYGRSDAGDGAMDAAVLSQAVGRPVRVQWSRHEGHAWGPKGPAAIHRMRAALDAEGNVLAYDFEARAFARQDVSPREAQPSATLAGHLLGFDLAPNANGGGFPDQSYSFPAMRFTDHSLPPLQERASPMRTAHFRDPSGPHTHYSTESFSDELALAVGMDPLEFRLKHVTDERDRAVLEAVAERYGWQQRVGPNPDARRGDVLVGRGIAYAQRNGSVNAIIADVEVNPATGVVWARKFTVASDHGLMINPRSLRNTIEGNIIQALSRTLFEEVEFDRDQVLAQDWSSYPILETPNVPEEIDIVFINRPEIGARGAGEPATRIPAAAVANAVFDATGVRIRRIPLTPERVKQALEQSAA
jgi:CO/xanthine dehydrogenase Mo-binding subunit